MIDREIMANELDRIGSKNDRLLMAQAILLQHYSDDPVLVKIADALHSNFQPRLHLSTIDFERWEKYEAEYKKLGKHELALTSTAKFFITSEESIKKSVSKARSVPRVTFVKGE